MNNECCKDKIPYNQRVGVYLTEVNRLNRRNIEQTLILDFNYTKSQVNTALKFVDVRGECLIYEGSKEDAQKKVDLLTQRKIKCLAKYKGLVK